MIDREKFLREGYLVFPSIYDITEQTLKDANRLLKDPAYKIGMRHVNSDITKLPKTLQALVYNKEISQFFSSLEKEQMLCRDTMITHEFKNDQKERNNWLHFDRRRSYKAMVYLTDVTEKDGPFSVVPRTHTIAAPLRRATINKSYQDRPNRIKLDYPELYQEPTKILGPAGTLILFDSDIFHEGGKIQKGHQRKLIRSHWYSTQKWRERS